MLLQRRSFLKLTAAGTTLAAFGGLGVDLTPAEAQAATMALRTVDAKVTTTICCYCSVGCSLLVHTDKKTGKAINVEGDPDHPINEGALCAKGASIYQLADNERRPETPLYRAPGSGTWEEKDWDWMLDTIAQRIVETREKSFTTKDAKGQVVNRCDGIASVGSAAMDNEENWVYQAWLRSMGLFYIEHQARI